MLYHIIAGKCVVVSASFFTKLPHVIELQMSRASTARRLSNLGRAWILLSTSAPGWLVISPHRRKISSAKNGCLSGKKHVQVIPAANCLHCIHVIWSRRAPRSWYWRNAHLWSPLRLQNFPFPLRDTNGPTADALTGWSYFGTSLPAMLLRPRDTSPLLRITRMPQGNCLVDKTIATTKSWLNP